MLFIGVGACAADCLDTGDVIEGGGIILSAGVGDEEVGVVDHFEVGVLSNQVVVVVVLRLSPMRIYLRRVRFIRNIVD